MSPALIANVDEFAGLSDRGRPLSRSRQESPALLNVDFFEKAIQWRRGYTRITTDPFKTGSARFDGYNDYGRIAHRTAYAPGAGNGIYCAFATVIRGRSVSATYDKTFVSKGYGAVGNRFIRVVYSVATGANPNGAWIATLWDVVAGALRTIEVADGTAGTSIPSDLYRFVEVYRSSDTAHTLKVWDYDGNVIGSATAAWSAGGGYVAGTEDWYLGVTATGAATPPAAGATDFASAQLAEFRYYTGTIANVATRIATTSNKWYQREIEDENISLFTGYWKLNDGTTTGTFIDSTSTANTGIFPQQPSAWNTNTAECLGASGLSFVGGGTGVAGGPSPFAWIKDTVTGTALNQTVFNGATARWSCGMIVVPRLAPGETTVRAQMLLKIGTAAANANPLMIYINGAQQFEAEYMDGPNFRVRTVTTAGFTATDLLGKKVRVCAMRTGSAGNGNFILEIAYQSPTGGTLVAASAAFALTNASPNLIDANIAIGRNVTSFTFPFTYGANNPAVAAIDDVRFVRWTSASSLYFGASSSPFQESPSLPGGFQMAMNARFNEGAGNVFRVEGLAGYAGKIVPEDNDGMRWDMGLVVPYRSPTVTLIAPYDRFQANGQLDKSVVVKAGTTLYRVSIATGAAIPIGGAPIGGICTAAQWREDMYVACANGKRPLQITGSSVFDLGIRAPIAGCVPTLGAGVGFNGTYQIYVTFRSVSAGERARESNPSPATQFTTAGVQQISSVAIPVSADPQVNQRRIWISLVGGTDGSTAFLAATVDDNTTTTYSTAITVAPTSGVPLEFLLNEEAPQGGLIEFKNDRAFVAGNQQFPTRVWYSSVLAPWAWDQDAAGRYNDVNGDNGNPVSAMWKNEDYVTASTSDGMSRLWSTGDSNNPVGQAELPVSHGAVGPRAWFSFEGGTFYVSERDIYATDGRQERNISSPENLQQPSPAAAVRGYLRQADLPSIQTIMREGINGASRAGIVASARRGKNQVWFCVPSSASTRNDMVLVYDYVEGRWSMYDLALDFIAEVDDGNDDPVLVGAIEGYLVRLDTGDYDGVATPLSGSVASVSSRTITFTAPTLAVDALRGLKMWLGIKNSAGYIASVLPVVIASNTASTITYYAPTVATIKAGDVWCVGPFPAYADFMVDHGQPLHKKKMRWARFVGESDRNETVLRMLVAPDAVTRNPSWDDATEHRVAWHSDATFQLLQPGGVFRSGRLRLSNSSGHQSVCPIPFPPDYGRIKIDSFEIQSEPVGVP